MVKFCGEDNPVLPGGGGKCSGWEHHLHTSFDIKIFWRRHARWKFLERETISTFSILQTYVQEVVI